MYYSYKCSEDSLEMHSAEIFRTAQKTGIFWRLKWVFRFCAASTFLISLVIINFIFQETPCTMSILLLFTSKYVNLHQSAFRAQVTAVQPKNINENKCFAWIMLDVNGWQMMQVLNTAVSSTPSVHRQRYNYTIHTYNTTVSDSGYMFRQILLITVKPTWHRHYDFTDCHLHYLHIITDTGLLRRVKIT